MTSSLQNHRRLQEEEFVPGTDSQVIEATFRVYGSIFLVLIVAFCVLRKRYPRLYNIRKWAPNLQCELAQREYGFISWMWKVYKPTDDELLDQCGMDALCFLRILRFGFKISCMGIFNSFWLIPMYVTAKDSNRTVNVRDPVEEMTTGHLPIESKRFIGTVIGAYIIFLYTMFLVLQEFEWFTEKRHQFLTKRTPRNYAVYVTGIPREYRSSQLLLEYFQSCFSKSGVLEAHVVLDMDIPVLERQVAQREHLVAKLEHALEIERIRGVAPTHRSVAAGDLFAPVDSIRAYEAELARMNQEIREAVENIRRNAEQVRLHSELSDQHVVTGHVPLSPGGSSEQGNRKRTLTDAMQLFPLEEIRSWGSDADHGISRRFFRADSQYRAGEDIEEVLLAAPRESFGTHPDISRMGEETETAAKVTVDANNAVELVIPVNYNYLESVNSIDIEQPDEEWGVSSIDETRYGGNTVLTSDELQCFQNLKLSSAPETLSNFATNEKSMSEIDQSLNMIDLQGDEVEQADELDNSTERDAIRQWNDALMLVSGPADLMLQVRALEAGHGDIGQERARRQGLSVIQHKDPIESREQSANASTPCAGSGGDHTSRLGLENLGSALKKAAITSKTSVAQNSEKLVKVVTGNSTEEIKRHFDEILNEVNVKGLKKATDKGVDNLKKVTKHSVKLGVNEFKSLTDVGTSAIREVATTAKNIIIRSDDGAPRDAGFVVFRKLSTTHAALQMIHNSKPYVMDVEEAPEPDDIYYANVGKSAKSRQIGHLLSFALSAVLCFFWTIPVSFISSLTSVDSLKKALPFLSNVIDSNPWIDPLMAQLAPLLLIVLNMLLPAILTEFAKLEGHIASSALGASVFLKMSAFMIIQTFFVSAFTGGITDQLAALIDDPDLIIDLLANSLPLQGTYFVQILLVATFIGQGVELLRVRPLALAFLRSKIGPRLTKKERKTKVYGLRPLSDPHEFEHAEVFANVVLYFMVMFVYAIISPIINYFVAFCFIIIGSGYRYQLIHNYPTNPDSGGKLWSGFIGICLTCMVIAQITLVGLLALKKATYATPCLVPLILLTIGFNIYLRIKHFYVTNHLPTRDCLRLDKEHHRYGRPDFLFVKGKYLQPALNAEDVFPEIDCSADRFEISK